MKLEKKTKKQLINEILELRQQLSTLEASESGRKRGEEKPHLEIIRGEDLFNAIGQQTMILDPQSRVISVNRAVVERIGIPAKELEGKKCYEIYHGTDQPPEGCPMKKLETSKQVEIADMVVETLGGTFMISCTPIFNESDQLSQVIHIATDITERKQAYDEIRHLKNFNEGIVQNMLEGIIVMDVEGIIIFINPATSALLGYSPEELIGQHWKAIVPPDQYEIVDGAEDRRARGESDHYELILTRKNETRFSVRVGSGPRYDEGQFAGSIAVFTDISEGKLAEEALRKSEQEYRALFEYSNDAVILLSLDGVHLAANPKAAEMFGYSMKELVGMTVEDFVVPYEYPDSMNVLERLKAGETLPLYERIFRTKDGVEFPAELKVSLIYDPEGNPSLIQSIIRDITQRKEAETTLKESERRLKKAEHRAQLGHWELDLITNALYWSDEIYRIFGLEPQEFDATYEAFLEAIHPDDREFVNQAYTDSVNNKTIYDIIHRLQLRDGTLKYVNEKCETEYDEDGNPIRSLGTIQNITQRVRADEALRKHAHDLGERIKELNCLYSVSSLVQDEDISPEEMFQGVVDLIPPGWQYPDITCARLKLEEQVFNTENFAETAWIQASDIVLRGDIIGALEVSYLEERPESDEGPFLKDERNLINALAKRVGDTIERKRAREHIQCQLERLSALHSIDIAITSSLDLRLTLDVILDQVIGQLAVDAAAILLVDPLNRLTFAAGRGFRALDEVRTLRLRLGESFAGLSALERRIISISDLREVESDISPTFRNFLAEEEFVAYHAVPLIAKGQLLGVLEVFHRASLDSDPEWMAYLETLAGQAAIAINNAELFDGLQSAKTELEAAYDATLEGWVSALEMRDEETEGHTQRVTDMTVRLAKTVGAPEEELIHYYRGALLHDIGKLVIPDAILQKPGKLTPEEWEIMRNHPVIAHQWLSPIAYLKPALDIPFSHHEKWDGTGYPQGLKGEQIPLAARIFAIIDVWDALRSDRPYRDAWSEEKVREHIREQTGTHFDPQVTEAFLDLMELD